MKFSLERFKMFLILILVCFLASCATKGGEPISEMPDKEKVIIMMDVYNQQAIDYMIKAGFTKMDGKWVETLSIALTDAQKEILKKKKEILSKVYPMIFLYDSFVTNNRRVTPDMEQKIFSLLDSLTLLIYD